VTSRDIILSGVGGQGILSIAYVICQSALQRGLNMKQSEVHGMAQRGGAVVSHVRLSAAAIHSDIIPAGRADVILSVEPLEALRYMQYLAPEGVVVASATPVKNIPDYPDLEGVLQKIARFPRHVLVDAKHVARLAGSARAENMVMLGAASEHLGFAPQEFEPHVKALFARKKQSVIDVNLKALVLGRSAARLYVQHRDKQVPPGEALERIAEMSEPALAKVAG
jgi:indolepyruvate ferredoxin oxidoreductase beta subunit